MEGLFAGAGFGGVSRGGDGVGVLSSEGALGETGFLQEVLGEFGGRVGVFVLLFG